MEMHDFRFPHGSTHLLAGPSGSGKTVRVANILRQKNSLIVNGDKIKNVVFCYASWQPLFTELKNEKVVSKWINKMPSAEEYVELVESYKNLGGSIVVIDDFMGEIGKDLDEIVRVLSRHNNTSTFILFQNLFPPHRLARQISLNVKFIHIHKNPRENAQIQYLARQIVPQSFRWIVAAYHEATKEPYSAFLIDLTQERDKNFRFRSRYLPSEKPMKVWIEKGVII